MTRDDAVQAELEELNRKMESETDPDQRLMIGDQIEETRARKRAAQKVVPIRKKQGGKDRSESRQARVSLPEAVRILRSAQWDRLAYNERTTELVWLDKPPCDTAHHGFPAPLVDADFTSIVSAFDAEDMALSYETAIKAAVRAATFRSFDPVRDYLDALAWDGTGRLDEWLEAYFGADPEDEDEATWNATIGARWLIAAVARVYDPGCQVDTILIAEGPQGVGKSSAFRALAVQDDWFACDLPDIRNKDAVHHVLGPWLVELDELDALSRKEATSVKSYVSRRTDRARLSYGKVSTNHPRRVVFCGTTNEDTYNSDATGGRRFWPFRVRNKIDVAAITRDRDQLWAEAVHRYKSGEAWHLDNELLERLAKAEQEKRFKGGPWLEVIDDYLTGKTEVSVADILDRLDVPAAQRNQRHTNEVARCLQHLGWIRTRVRRDGKRVYLYTCPQSVPPQATLRGDGEW